MSIVNKDQRESGQLLIKNNLFEKLGYSAPIIRRDLLPVSKGVNVVLELHFHLKWSKHAFRQRPNVSIKGFLFNRFMRSLTCEGCNKPKTSNKIFADRGDTYFGLNKNKKTDQHDVTVHWVKSPSAKKLIMSLHNCNENLLGQLTGQ